jgi:AraC family transcriptional regulator of arabinose operon
MGSGETPASPAGILRADRFREQPGYHVRRRAGTRDWLMFLTCAGQGRFRLATHTWQSIADDITILSPGIPHDYAAASSDVPWDFYWAHFLPRPHWSAWLQQFPQEYPGFYKFSLAGSSIHQRLVGAWERVLRDNRSPGVYQEDLALNALEEVLLLLAQVCTRSALHPLDPRVEKVIEQLTYRISDPPSVADLARLVSLSPSRLAHLFKAQTGDSLAATLLKVRLRYATRLLTVTSLPINEIAWQIGFQSPFHFSRQFKIYYGVSPTKYRDQHTPTPLDDAQS